MGNRQAYHKEESKSRGDSKYEKEEQKKRKQQKQTDKSDAGKTQTEQYASELDADKEESSHVTGGDSESCIFHSAENISFSPYLDSSTGCEFEHSTTRSRLVEHSPILAQHPYVLSSKDFQDGFSLEACIPPEIVRPEAHTSITSTTWTGHRDSNLSVNSSIISQPEVDVKATCSGLSSPVTCGNITSTTSFSGNTERVHVHIPSVSTFDPEYKTDLTQSQEAQPASPTSYHHPHFYNHHHNRKCQQASPISITKPTSSFSQSKPTSHISVSKPTSPVSQAKRTSPVSQAKPTSPVSQAKPTPPVSVSKPTSPKAQRGTASPKVVASPLKITSSNNASPAPTTPSPQRRATNFLALFRSSSKREKATSSDGEEKQTDQASEMLGTNDDVKGKSKPLWKTWERSRSKKSKKQNKVSIFGTTRKPEVKESTDNVTSEETGHMKASANICQFPIQCKTDRNIHQSIFIASAGPSESKASNSNSAQSDSETRQLPNQTVDFKGLIREDSPPLSSTAAFCILKLEELERSIEKTIREKFPDAEPFLMRKRSKEELRGSRSLPTTPSLNKKLYVAREEDVNITSSRLVDDRGATRFCHEIYESPPNSSKSPVVLRRFGARTRHASISPKIQRTKTGALFNSPSEMSNLDASLAAKSATKKPGYHELSFQQTSAPILHSNFDQPFSVAQKSESKYDNVMDDATENNAYCQLVRLNKDNRDLEVETMSRDNNKTRTGDIKQVIVPSFSAVFGSVSPKLKRHNQVTFCDSKKGSTDPDIVHTSGNISSQVEAGNGKDHSKGVKNVNKAVASSLGHSDSTENSHQPINQSEQNRQGRCGQYVTSAQGNDIETRSKKTAFKDICRAQDSNRTMSVPDVPKSINSSKIVVMAASGQDTSVHCDDNRGLDVMSNIDTAGNASNSTEERKLNTQEPSECTRVKTLPATQPPDIAKLKIAGKPGQLASPSTEQKHSSDHVVLVSAVARPCRAVPSSPGQETACKSSHSAHAHATAPYPSPGLRYASKHSAVSTQGEVKHQRSYTTGSVSTRTPVPGSVTVSSDTPLHLLQADVADGVLPKFDDVQGRLYNHPVEAASDQLDYVFPDQVQEVRSEFLSGFHSSKLRKDEVASPKIVNVIDSVQLSKQRQHQYSELEQPVPESEEQPRKQRQHQQGQYSEPQYPVPESEEQPRKQRQNDDVTTVLKQPVSQVISQMINLSKRQPQQQETQRLLQQQPRRLHQTDSTSPNDGMQPKPAVAIVTIPHYEQSCQTLEKKIVTVTSNSSRNIPNDLCQSRCQEIQTDSYTTADKSVDSNGLTDTFRSSEVPSSGRSAFLSTPTTDPGSMEGEKVAESSDYEDSEFLKMVQAGSTTQIRKHTDESRTVEHVPPPSPKAMHQLMEEMGEETDNDEENKRTETLRSTKEHEIKQFTEIIYKRLSDLLCSQSKEETNEDSKVSVLDGAAKGDNGSDVEISSKFSTYRDSTSTNTDEIMTSTELSAATLSSSAASTLIKVLTIDSSSSLTTTTSSDSEIDETSRMFKTFQNTNKNNEESFENIEVYLKKNEESKTHVFRGLDVGRTSNDPGQKQSSRVYHSDDDVATGRGIPDYYDDRPLWSRRQKLPGELSATMMAIRWRERRERWLKKRRRNRTDLMSTASSDTGSENCLNRDYSLMSENSNYFDNEKEGSGASRTNVMGSGILTSPKYTKPILPFFDSNRTRSTVEDNPNTDLSGRPRPFLQFTQRQDIRTHFNSKMNQAQSTGQDDSDNKNVHQKTDNKNVNEQSSDGGTQKNPLTHVDMSAPTIDDTFQELISVQNILDEMQELRPSDENIERKCLPLTTENVRSIREYYKDYYLSGSGRRSRMSATDRTESDLDLYSEIRDDASSGSEVYADDEGDDDRLEMYATAEDEQGATGQSSSTGGRGSKRGGTYERDDNDTDASVVLSCTFYNSNTHPEKTNEQSESGTVLASAAEVKTTKRSTSVSHVHTSQVTLHNSDDEFWSQSVVMDESYKQLETAADAVSSTFQNAREQMHDIQYHLQALRRQMEVMQDDLTNISITLTPHPSIE